MKFEQRITTNDGSLLQECWYEKERIENTKWGADRKKKRNGYMSGQVGVINP